MRHFLSLSHILAGSLTFCHSCNILACSLIHEMHAPLQRLLTTIYHQQQIICCLYFVERVIRGRWNVRVVICMCRRNVQSVRVRFL
ncbi:unnamed protein product [Sphagnum tenellum]